MFDFSNEDFDKLVENHIESACLYFDHSYGMATEERKKQLQFEAKEWLHSWRKVIEDIKMKGE